MTSTGGTLSSASHSYVLNCLRSSYLRESGLTVGYRPRCACGVSTHQLYLRSKINFSLPSLVPRHRHSCAVLAEWTDQFFYLSRAVRIHPGRVRYFIYIYRTRTFSFVYRFIPDLILYLSCETPHKYYTLNTCLNASKSRLLHEDRAAHSPCILLDVFESV